MKRQALLSIGIACVLVLMGCSTPDTPAPEDYYLTSRPSNRISQSIFEVPAGGSMQFFAHRGDYLGPDHEQVEVLAWSVEPMVGISIDEEGVLSADATVAHLTPVTIQAHTKAGIIEEEALVYSPDENPLVGAWQEVEQPNCGTSERLREVMFLADGRAFATWHPFEVNVDYEMHYSVDPDAGTVTFSEFREVSWSPGDQELGSGRFAIDEDGLLEFQNVYFGSMGLDPANRCERYLFER